MLSGVICDGGERIEIDAVAILVPLLGAVLGSIWTDYTIRVPPNKVYASVFTYNGRQKPLNRLLALFSSVLWIVFSIGLAHVL